MLEEIRAKLEEEIERLTHELSVVLPDAIRRAAEQGDLKENAEYISALERQSFVQARLDHLRRRMTEISRIDPKAIPADRVGFGSRVEVHDLELDERISFTIVVGDYMDLDGRHVSLASPIGRGLLGATVDEEVEIRLPVGLRRFRVVDLVTLPQQLGMSDADGDGNNARD